jgi:hypothetical protein
MLPTTASTLGRKGAGGEDLNRNSLDPEADLLPLALSPGLGLLGRTQSSWLVSQSAFFPLACWGWHSPVGAAEFRLLHVPCLTTLQLNPKTVACEILLVLLSQDSGFMYLLISGPWSYFHCMRRWNQLLLDQVTIVTVAPHLLVSQIFGSFTIMGILVVSVRSASAYLDRNKELNIQERQKNWKSGKDKRTSYRKGESHRFVLLYERSPKAWSWIVCFMGSWVFPSPLCVTNSPTVFAHLTVWSSYQCQSHQYCLRGWGWIYFSLFLESMEGCVSLHVLSRKEEWTLVEAVSTLPQRNGMSKTFPGFPHLKFCLWAIAKILK